MTKQADIMVITPHPDDAEFGVAGTVVRWVSEGKDVIYVVCTNGDKGTSDPDIKPDELARTREQEQRAAAKLLGVRDVVFLGYSDQVEEVLLWASEDPNCRYDITDTFDTKIAALRCHKSQVEDNLPPDWEDRLRQWFMSMAEGEDFELAEAFHRAEVQWRSAPPRKK